MEQKNNRSVKEQVSQKTRIKFVVAAFFVLLILVIGAITISNFAKGLGDSHNLMG